MSKGTDMASQKIVVAAPMSYAGSGARIWKLTRLGPVGLKLLTVPVALVLVATAWAVVTGWYAIFGLLVFPYRLVRRGQRKEKRDTLRHQELLTAGRQSS